MAIVYKQCGGAGKSVEHFCDPCSTTELGGIRSTVLIRKDSTFNITSDLKAWEMAIQNNEVIIIPETKGSYDGGTPKNGPGYGDRKERVLGYDFVSNFKDPSYKENLDFWKWAEKQEWRYGFRTASLLHITDTVVQLTAKAPVDEDIDSEVVWNVEVKWFSVNKPSFTDCTPIKKLFSCFHVTGGVSGDRGVGTRKLTE